MAIDTAPSVQKASIAVVAAIFISDVADGYLARRWRVSSKLGYLLDGVGDRASYIACLFLLEHKLFVATIAFFLIVVRDVSLYAARAFYPNWDRCSERHRWLTKSYAFLVKLGIVAGLGAFYLPLVIEGVSVPPVAVTILRYYFDAFCLASYVSLASLLTDYSRSSEQQAQ
jgi:phosphatidylglycerophosphate synthase